MYGLMRLGRDAEVKTLPSGKQVANLSLVYNFGQKEGDEYPSQWIDAAFWGERAEKLAPYLLKGSLHCFTLGDVHIETYTDKEGYEAFKLSARVDDVELGPKRDGGQGGGSEAPPPRRQAAPAQRPAESTRASPAGGSGFEDMPDDVPFANPLARRGLHLAI